MNTTTKLESGLYLRYLDTTTDAASISILNELGIELFLSSKDNQDSKNIPLDLSKENTLQLEHTCTSSVKYIVLSGRLILDIRDAANCWIRCEISSGISVMLPSSVYRRFNFPLDAIQCLNQNVTVATINIDPTAELIPRFRNVADSLVVQEQHNYRQLVCELCAEFYQSGWVTGTGGSISVRHGNRIYMTPSGVPKERIRPEELFMLDLSGKILSFPPQTIPSRIPKLSDCSPLFLHAYQLRQAGAVLHSHGMECNLITALCGGKSEFRISHQEMIKGLVGHGFGDELVIPIIENTPKESELADSLRDAILHYPKASAVLVRSHGIYVWGDSWQAAKRHAECLHYLFELALDSHRLGLPASGNESAIHKRMRDGNSVGGGGKRQRINGSTKFDLEGINCIDQYQYVLLDIEGTTTPITFVKDILFPYAAKHVQAFLEQSWTNLEIQKIIEDLRDESKKANADIDHANGNYPPLVADANACQNVLLKSVVDNILWNIQMDKKVRPMKQLQGLVWDQGYKSGDLTAQVYPDVPDFFRYLKSSNVRVGIYSSGSRQAQRLVFQYSDKGNLLPYICGFFDTTSGQKREKESYAQILQSIGIAPENASSVLFITDIIEEAQAANATGLHVLLSSRPGNFPLPENCPFPIVKSFTQLVSD